MLNYFSIIERFMFKFIFIFTSLCLIPGLNNGIQVFGPNYDKNDECYG